MQDPELRAGIGAKVRTYLSGTVTRYVPVFVGALALILLVVLVPDAVQNEGGSSPLVGSGSYPESTTGGPATTGPVAGVKTPGQASGVPGAAGTGVPTSGAAVPTANATVPTAETGGATSAPSSVPPGVGGSTSNVAVSGVQCGTGVRQFTWSPYAPMCVGKWSGNNGGATAHGVTATTITLVLRDPSDWDTTAKATGVPTFAEIAHDEQVLVDYFNGQYELYGRKVVIKTFNGQGSFFAEGANQDQAGASADATTAYNDGAFVDGFPITTGTYSDAEASRTIISFAPGNSESAYKANAPYMYGVPLGPVADVQGAGVGAVACQRMAHMNAVFAGSAAFRNTVRSFGILEPEQPEYAGGGAVVEQDLKACGASYKYFQYNADINEEPQEAAEIAAEMKSDNVTTVLMLTDPFMAEFMTDAASQAEYQPEWVMTVLQQAMARQADASEMAHAIDVDPWHATTGAPSQRLCARIYDLASHGATPASAPIGLDGECSLLMALFGALQQAGPVLTPQSLARGWFSLPPSNGASDFGEWSFGPGYWSPDASMSLLQWNATAKSSYDGGTGEWQACGGPAQYPYQNANLGSGQLQCFGQ